nr:MAG TPA: ExsB [Microviridae sp.]
MKCTSPLKLGSRIVPCGKCYACRSKRRNQWYCSYEVYFAS